MKPSKKLEGSSILWDNSYIAEPALGRCIQATPQEFEVVANYLLSSVALAYPDESKLDELVIENFNSFLRNAAHRIAIQMLTLMSNCGLVEGGMRLRQKTGFPCIMQQEQSEGVWVDVFDYALCLEGALTDALNQQSDGQEAKDAIKGAVDLSNLLFQDYLDNYTGTSASYDPRLILTGEGQDDARNALCATITETVNNYVASSIDLKQTQVDNQGRAALGIGAGIAIIGLLGAAIAFPPLAALLPTLLTTYLSVGTLGLAGAVLGATATGLGIWSQVIKDNDIAPLENGAAVNRVICLWFTQLNTEEDISLEDYRAALDLSEETTDVQKVWEMITPLIQIELSYAAFLTAWKKNLGYAEAGEPIEDCGCDEAALDLVFPGSNWDNSEFEFIGKDSNGHEVWIATLQGENMNASNALYFHIVNAGTISGYRPTKVKSMTYLSGTASDVYFGSTLYPTDIIPDGPISETILIYGTSFPLVVRFAFEPQPE